MNNDDKDLLGGINKLCQTGMEATKTVIPKVNNQQLKNELQEQYNDYSSARSETEQALVSAGVMPQEQSLISKGTMWGSIQLHTIGDSSADHIAEIMINGTTMGIIDMTKHIGSCRNADKKTIDYAKSFVENEERHVDNLKAFL